MMNSYRQAIHTTDLFAFGRITAPFIGTGHFILNLKKFARQAVCRHKRSGAKADRSEDGRTVAFEMKLPEDWEAYYYQFNWWGTRHPSQGQKGILMKYPSFFQLITD